MDDRIEKLKTLQTNSLIDVVQNYKKYNYTLQIRAAALKILAERGISNDTLELTGNLKNYSYEKAITEYKKYNRNSIIGLIIFFIAILLFNANALLGIITYLVALLFIGFSFANQRNISKILKDHRVDNSPLVIVMLLSMLFYFIIYFITRKQLKERIELKT